MERLPGEHGAGDEPRVLEVDDIEATVEEEKDKGSQLMSEGIIDISHTRVAVMQDKKGKLIFIIELKNS